MNHPNTREYRLQQPSRPRYTLGLVGTFLAISLAIAGCGGDGSTKSARSTGNGDYFDSIAQEDQSSDDSNGKSKENSNGTSSNANGNEGKSGSNSSVNDSKSDSNSNGTNSNGNDSKSDHDSKGNNGSAEKNSGKSDLKALFASPDKVSSKNSHDRVEDSAEDSAGHEGDSSTAQGESKEPSKGNNSSGTLPDGTPLLEYDDSPLPPELQKYRDMGLKEFTDLGVDEQFLYISWLRRNYPYFLQRMNLGAKGASRDAILPNGTTVKYKEVLEVTLDSPAKDVFAYAAMYAQIDNHTSHIRKIRDFYCPNTRLDFLKDATLERNYQYEQEELTEGYYTIGLEGTIDALRATPEALPPDSTDAQLVGQCTRVAQNELQPDSKPLLQWIPFKPITTAFADQDGTPTKEAFNMITVTPNKIHTVKETDKAGRATTTYRSGYVEVEQVLRQGQFVNNFIFRSGDVRLVALKDYRGKEVYVLL